MSFFSNGSLGHDSQLRKKRSLTSFGRERKQSNGSAEESAQRTRAASGPSAIVANKQSSLPALPTRRSTEQPSGRRSTNERRDESSLPSNARQKKHGPPPPFTNLIIQVPPSQSDTKHYVGPPSKPGRRPPTSPEAREGLILPYSPNGRFVSSPISISTNASQHGQTTLNPMSLSLGNSSPSPITVRRRQSEDHPSTLAQQRSPFGLNFPSPFPKDHARTMTTSVSTPTSPRTRMLPLGGPPLPSPNLRPASASSSPTAKSFSSRSSILRVPVPRFDASDLTLGSTSGSGSGASVKEEGNTSKKKPRNLLRKPSLVRQRAPFCLTPNADTKFQDSSKGKEKEAKESRPKNFLARSRRNSIAALFDVVSPQLKPTTSLTPAREVVVAYQESQRLSEGDCSLKSGGTVIAVGGPEGSEVGKSNWTPPWTGQVAQDGHGDSDKPPSHKQETPLRALTRKMSTRLHTGERPGHGSNRRSISGAIELSNPAGSGAEVNVNQSVTSPAPIPYPQSATPRPKMSSGWPGAENEEGRVWEDRVGSWAFREQGKEKEKASPKEETELNPRGLWKLVKRLSSGNLKEKKHSPSEAPPPVPALPAHVVQRRARIQEPPDAERTPVSPGSVLEAPPGIMRYISSVPALAIPRARSLSRTKPLPDESGSPSSPPRSSSAAPRRWRSPTTRSSSPSSTNTGLFTRSRASSDSSYGESIPPIPGIPLAHVNNRSQTVLPTDGRSGKASDELVRSHKPRREKERVRDGTPSPTGSATIPSFDMQHPVNNFQTKKDKRVMPPSMSPLPTSADPPSAMSSSPQQSPPPIPKRSPFRLIGPKHATGPYRKQSMPDVKIVMQARPRPSFSTPKARPRSVSDGDLTIEVERPKESPGPSVFTFKELNAASARHLTEQEKNAKWEDLLRKSAKAGGTLYVSPTSTGGLGLWSDQRSSVAMSDKTETN
ncbi:hypothetical protein M422DRAFT_24581 [Sphaerobolus stellatus SS14]|nr:hypothetical protein M422DRAFT_24581 [Sphaerobolus stellatus SS14]